MAKRTAAAPPPENAFLVVEGRKWRRSDPGIPPALRQELVNELMAARRAVAMARDDIARRAARGRVNDAKVALGERGRAWWLEKSAGTLEPRLLAAMRALLRGRRADATICPSEAARVVDGANWRRLLPAVRELAAAEARDGSLRILRGGQPATGDPTKGVLRYALPPGDEPTWRHR